MSEGFPIRKLELDKDTSWPSTTRPPISVRGIDGNLVVNPGDHMHGNNDGVVVAPRES